MKVIQLTHKSVNSYLIPGNEGWVMIDTGWPDTFSQFLQLLCQNNISVYEINHLVITHFHPAHAGLTQNLKDLGINLILHESQINDYNKLNIKYKKNPQANFKDITSTNNIILTDYNSRNFMEEIGLCGELISTPGHSDDSISLVIDNDCAFIGDLPPYSIMEVYDDIVIEDSWDLIQQYHVRSIYPGHGDPYNI